MISIGLCLVGCTTISQNKDLHLVNAASIRTGQTKSQVLQIMGQPTEQRLATEYQPETWSYNQMQEQSNEVQNAVASEAIGVVGSMLPLGGQVAALGAGAAVQAQNKQQDTTSIVLISFKGGAVSSCKMQVSSTTLSQSGLSGANLATQVRETPCKDIGKPSTLTQAPQAFGSKKSVP
ncbi:outer membrane protein assembly factor BamE [Mesorhizobium sp. M1B.F.Ca.ET.045.04.1.1]|nr:outer membrane protein assembly factor BamE [Mesorhizobium sp. M1B.F.Ca.ET.045.04.1.1]